MGFFGYGNMDNECALDLQDELFGFIGVKYNDSDRIISSANEISNLLQNYSLSLGDWFEVEIEKENSWVNKKHLPFYYLALGQIILDYKIKVPNKLIDTIIEQDMYIEKEYSLPLREFEINLLMYRLKEKYAENYAEQLTNKD